MMLFAKDPKFRDFFKDFGAHEAFIDHLVAMCDSEAYARASELLVVLLAKSQKRRAVLLAGKVLKLKPRSEDEKRRWETLAQRVFSLKSQGEMSHICDRSPTGFGRPISTEPNICYFCVKEIK